MPGATQCPGQSGANWGRGWWWPTLLCCTSCRSGAAPFGGGATRCWWRVLFGGTIWWRLATNRRNPASDLAPTADTWDLRTDGQRNAGAGRIRCAPALRLALVYVCLCVSILRGVIKKQILYSQADCQGVGESAHSALTVCKCKNLE